MLTDPITWEELAVWIVIVFLFMFVTHVHGRRKFREVEREVRMCVRRCKGDSVCVDDCVDKIDDMEI